LILLNFVIQNLDEGLYHAVDGDVSFILKERNEVIKVEFSDYDITLSIFIVTEDGLD